MFKAVNCAYYALHEAKLFILYMQNKNCNYSFLLVFYATGTTGIGN